jgi:hypothetical protein
VRNLNNGNQIKLVKIDISELHCDTFRRKTIAKYLCEEATEQLKASDEKYKEDLETINMVISALEKYKDQVKIEIENEKKQKEKELWENKEKQLEKFAAMFRENHAIIEAEIIKQKENLENERQQRINEVEQEYQIKSYLLNPLNDPENYITEIGLEKGIISGDKNDFDMKLGSKVYDYYKNLQILEEEKKRRISDVEKDFTQKIENLEMSIRDFKEEVVQKEIEVIRRVVSSYKSSLKNLEKEYGEKSERKISDINKTIDSLKEKLNANLGILNSEKMRIQNEYKAKLESLMQPDIPKEFLSKYIYCKIETKKVISIAPSTSSEQVGQAEKKEEVEKNKSKEDNKDEKMDGVKIAGRSSEKKREEKNESQFAVKHSESVPNSQDQVNSMSWSYDQELKEKRKQRFARISRWIKIVVVSTITGAVLTHGPIYFLNERMKLISNEIQKNSEIVTEFSDVVKKSFHLKKEITATLEKIRKDREEKEKKKKNLSNASKSGTRISSSSIEVKYKLSFNPLSEIEEYEAAKFNLNEQIGIYKSRIGKMAREDKKLLKSIDSLVSQHSFSSYKLNQIASLIRATYSGVISKKELMDWIDYVSKAQEREIRALNKDFVNNQNNKQDLEKTIKQMKEMQRRQSIQEQNKNSESIGINQAEKKGDAMNKEPDNKKENTDKDKLDKLQFKEEEIPKEAIQSVEVKNLLTSETRVEEKQKEIDKAENNNSDTNSVNQPIIKIEEMTKHIIMCGEEAKVVVAPSGTVLNDNDPDLCK